MYIALSPYGHPAPFLGVFFTRRELVTHILAKGCRTGTGGYRPVKVRVTER